MTILYNNVFYYIGFKVRQNYLRSETQEEIINGDFFTGNEFLIIKISNAEERKIKWIEKDEVLVNNQLFDVFKKNKTNDYLILYCKEDVKESKLIGELIDFVERQFDQSSNAPSNKSSIPVNKIFENLISYQDQYFSFQRLYTYSIQFLQIETNLYVNTVIRDIIHPPQL